MKAILLNARQIFVFVEGKLMLVFQSCIWLCFISWCIAFRYPHIRELKLVHLSFVLIFQILLYYFGFRILLKTLC